MVRWYLGNGIYRREMIGVADDLIAEGNLSFEQAIKKGRDFVAGIRAFGLRENGVSSCAVTFLRDGRWKGYGAAASTFKKHLIDAR